MVRPDTRLWVVYGGGRVEYHVYPAHLYLPPDRAGWRRNSLAKDLVPREVLHHGRRPFVLSFLMRVCSGGDVYCMGPAAAPGSCEAEAAPSTASDCRLAVVTATVTRL